MTRVVSYARFNHVEKVDLETVEQALGDLRKTHELEKEAKDAVAASKVAKKVKRRKKKKVSGPKAEAAPELVGASEGVGEVEKEEVGVELDDEDEEPPLPMDRIMDIYFDVKEKVGQGKIDPSEMEVFIGSEALAKALDMDSVMILDNDIRNVMMWSRIKRKD
jgi:hypothetical protein